MECLTVVATLESYIFGSESVPGPALGVQPASALAPPADVEVTAPPPPPPPADGPTLSLAAVSPESITSLIIKTR